MPRSTGSLVNNNFSKGLITEAPLLTFPKDACTDTVDCIHLITGGVTRRLGWDYEIDHQWKTIDRTNAAITSFIWKDVAGEGDVLLVVLQVGNHLYFYDGSTTDPLSSKAILATIVLSDFSAPGAPSPATKECQFATGNGKLFVAHPYLESFVIEYDADNQTVSASSIFLRIRDFEGVDDGLDIDQRPIQDITSISNEHLYNLKNQGWTIDILWQWSRGGPTLNSDGTVTNNYDPADSLPSNCDVQWSFKNSLGWFDVANIFRRYRGNSPAPKGHYIIDAYTKNRGEVSVLNIPNDSTGYRRVSCIAFFSGRVFYSGLDFEGRNSNIYFSQIIERDEQVGHCYQVNDPTSEDAFDLLPSDGGVIKIQEAGTIQKLMVVPGGLLAFASNGIWLISGSTGLGFTANDYSVTKLSSIQSESPTSFVDVAGTPMWWNLEGIYRVAGTGNGYQVESLTNTTIQTFYDTIPPSEKRNVRGFFNPIEFTVQWLFKSTESTSLQNSYEFDKILNLDIRTGGFFVWTIPTSADNSVHGLIVLETRGSGTALEDVTANDSTDVTSSDGSTTQIWSVGSSVVTPKFKYITSSRNNDLSYSFTFSETRRTEYKDWITYTTTGEDYTSSFTSGYTVPNPNTDFQNNYTVLYCDVGSKFYVQGMWDFSISGNSGRWSNKQLIDSPVTTNYSDGIFRRKIRGHGKALQIKVTSYPGSDFNISGWGAFLSSNQLP